MAGRWHGKEGRWGARVNVDIPVKVSAASFAGTDGCLRNLSLSGALMKANVDVGVRSLIKVCVKMPSPSRHTEAITAYVSRRTREGVGVEWCEFAPSIIKDLLRSPAIPLPT